MNKISLHKKWWVPVNDISGIAQLKSKRLINHIFDNMCDKSHECCDIRHDSLSDKALFFTKSEKTGNYSYEVIRIGSSIPSETISGKEVGLALKLFVKTWDSLIKLQDECYKLCDHEGIHSGKWCHEEECVYSSYADGHVRRAHANRTHCGEWFHRDYQPDTVHWSEWNDMYVDEDSDNVCYGYVDDSHEQQYFHSYDAITDEDGDVYADSSVASDHGIHWSDRYDCWTSKEEINASYQSQERVFKFTPRTSFGIGFEIEKEDRDAIDIPWRELYNQCKWAKENDGSLCDDWGYELVSPAFDLFDDGLEKDIQANRDLRTLINGEFTTNCGGHITLSSSEYTANELLEGVAGFIPLLYALYEGRLENSYCAPKQKWVYHRGSGRDAINIRSNRAIDEANGKVFGAIEFRLFSAVRSVNNLYWRRDLMKIIANNINKSEQDVLRMLCNPKSLLFKHLVKIYSVDRIIHKIRLFVEFAKQYNFRKIQMPDLDAIKQRLKKSNDKNESTNELGA